MRGAIPFVPVLLFCRPLAAGEWARKPSFSHDGTSGRSVVTFALGEASDVEVAILGARGAVVRHLAAGVLGGERPPPRPLGPGSAQRIEWDGTNDYGERVDGGPFTVRVRVGMGVKLERIVGGYIYVGDTVNCRLLRVRKTYELVARAREE